MSTTSTTVRVYRGTVSASKNGDTLTVNVTANYAAGEKKRITQTHAITITTDLGNLKIRTINVPDKNYLGIKGLYPFKIEASP